MDMDISLDYRLDSLYFQYELNLENGSTSAFSLWKAERSFAMAALKKMNTSQFLVMLNLKIDHLSNFHRQTLKRSQLLHRSL